MARLFGYLRSGTSTSPVTKIQPASSTAEDADTSSLWASRWWKRSSTKSDPLRISTVSTQSEDSDFSDLSPKSDRKQSPLRSPHRKEESPRTSWADSTSTRTSTSSKRSSSVSARSPTRSSTVSVVSSRSSALSNRSSRFSINSTMSQTWSESDVPDLLTNRDDWFNYWNDPENGGSGNDQMSQKQVVNALRKTFRMYEKQTIESIVSETWLSCGEPKFSLLGKEAIMKPQCGLIDTAHMVLQFSS